MVRPVLRFRLPRSSKISIHHRHLQTTSSTPLYPNSSILSYSLGISYAGKDSPPFIPPQTKAKPYGFAHVRGKPDSVDLAKWVQSMLELEAGRGELSSIENGGWGEKLAEERKKWGAGEDFFAIAKKGKDIHLALSDGVGGWSSTVDPSLFSQGLMYHYAQSISRPTDYDSTNPKDLIRIAYDALLKDSRITAGGGTAVGVQLKENGEAVFANLGDSGYAILRQDQIHFFSTPQTHYFNCPVQLSKVPESMRSHGIIHDSPGNAEVKKFSLLPGDIVILYTDGLSDNLPSSHIPLLSSTLTKLLDSEVNSHLSPMEKSNERARLLADILVGYGRMAMTRTGYEDGWKTPFEVEAKKEVPKANFRGGKVDDITVITAVVSELD